MKTLIALLLLLLLAVPVAAQTTGEFALNGAVNKPANWSEERLRKSFAYAVRTITYRQGGKQHRAHAVPLHLLVQVAGLQTTPGTKHGELQMFVLVTGRDGYRVLFSLAELLPDVGNRPVWVALDEDDAPLAPNLAPARLIVPDDKKPARWLYGIARVSVVNMSGLEAK